MDVVAAEQREGGLRLPPVYRPVIVAADDHAFDHACRIAPEHGAGAFVLADRKDVLDFAVVLEPEEPLVSARRALFAGMSAVIEALSAFAPPEKPITLAWPASVLFDGGRLGGARLGWPAGCDEDQVPEWLVFSAMLLAIPDDGDAPGSYAAVTWLEEEGFDRAEHRDLVESFARHLMVTFDTWAERGFAAVADSYLARLPRRTGEGRRGIDRNGDLLLHEGARVERIPLRPALDAAAWWDPGTRLPRLAP